MTLTIFIPQDTTAVAVGANRVAAAFLERAKALNVDLQIIRNGSRGAFGLEPLVEVERGEDRIVFGAVKVSDVPGIVDCLTSGSYEHETCLGSSADIPWFSAQTRITFKRCGIGVPMSLDDYRALGGYEGLQRALTLSPQAIVDEVKTSGLRGRGGAAFPTGIKWQTVLDTHSEQKYIVCNADEGDSGTFADR